MASVRNALGRFLTGNNGGPGRPKGARNRLGEDFLGDLYADWSEHGAAVIAQVRERSLAVYLRVVAGLVPQQVGITTTSEMREEVRAMTDEELNEAMVQAALTLGWRLLPPTDGEPALPGPEAVFEPAAAEPA